MRATAAIKHTLIGPGGWKCYCCTRTGKFKKLVKRQAKRRLNRALDKELQ